MAISKFDFHAFIDKLNEAARSHPIGKLQTIRAELHGKRRSGEKIFSSKTIADDWAFHHGGRTELQFNIGFDGSNDDMFRSGVAFSFQISQTLPTIDVLIPKVRLFNDFLRFNPDFYSDMRMWHWGNDGRSSESPPGPILPELMATGVFIFLGNLRQINVLIQK